MPSPRPPQQPTYPGQGLDVRSPTLTRVALYVWLAVAFVLLWLHFSSVRIYLDWRIYSLYFLAVAGVAGRYLTGIRHGNARWHRVVFDTLSILFIALGVNQTGGIHSDLWLLYFIFVIAETLAASARGFLITDVAAVLSYVIATWPAQPAVLNEYFERLITRVFFLVLVALIARALAAQERQKQQDLAALTEALSVSEERRRLARDLHDGVGHVLTRVILSLELGRRMLRQPVAEASVVAAEECVAQQATALRGAMEEMRQLVATLRTDTAAFQIGAAVLQMAEQLSQPGHLEVKSDITTQSIPLSPHRQYHLSRVIQEALTNCVRHSGATLATVELKVEEDPLGEPVVVATVTDNGKGFDPEAPVQRPGHGLTGMRERLAPYQGQIEIRSAPGAGTTLRARLGGDLPV